MAGYSFSPSLSYPEIIPKLYPAHCGLINERATKSNQSF